MNRATPANTDGIAQASLAAGFTNKTVIRCAVSLLENFGNLCQAVNSEPLLIGGQYDTHLPRVVGMFMHK